MIIKCDNLMLQKKKARSTMIFRHKKLKTAMAMMAILSIFGGSVNTIYAGEISQNQSVISVKNNEIHKLNVVLKHETKDEESSANKYVQRSYLKVENNKKIHDYSIEFWAVDEVCSTYCKWKRSRVHKYITR